MKPFYISKDFTYIRILIKYYIRLIKTNQFNKDIRITIYWIKVPFHILHTSFIFNKIKKAVRDTSSNIYEDNTLSFGVIYDMSVLYLKYVEKSISKLVVNLWCRKIKKRFRVTTINVRLDEIWTIIISYYMYLKVRKIYVDNCLEYIVQGDTA